MILKILNKIISLLIICIILLLSFSTISYATSVSYTGVSSVGSSTINIENISWYDPDEYSVTGNLKYTNNSSYNVSLIYWNTSSVSSGSIIKGTYTLFYENVGTDSEGDSIDLTLYSSVVTENVHSSKTISWDSSTLYYSVMHLSKSKCTAMSQPRYVSDTSDASGDGLVSYTTYLNTYQDISVTFTKHGSSTSAAGNFLFYVNDIDTVRDGDRYSEAIKLGSAFNSSTVYLETDTTVAVSNSNKTYTATEKDDSTDISGFTTLVSSPFTFTWYGTNCGTVILNRFASYDIISNIYTSTDGGSTYSLSTDGGWISATNTTTSTSNYPVLSQITSTSETITAYWKNNYEYETTANNGYHLVKIIYDDETLTSTSSYTFEEVTSDHTFNVYYVANSYNVLFDGNGATSGSTDDMEDLYYDTTYTLNENGFVRTGYTFIGWNTEADGSGTSYEDEESFSNLTYEDGGTVTLYAQWEAIPCNIYVYYVDYNTGETLDNYSYTGIYGESVATSSKDFDGYTLVKSPDTEDYTLDLDDIYVYYYYAKISDVIVYYLDYYTNEEIASSETIEGYEGLSYTTEQKEISNYEFITSTSNTSGTMEDDTIYVYYYYEELVDLEFVKVNYNNEPLEGVKFSLFKLICTNSEHDHTSDLIDVEDYDTSCWELVGTFSSDENGIIYLDNLYISGVYRLVETKTLTGYTLPTGQLQIEFNYNDNLSEEDIVTLGDLELSITAVGNSPKVSIASDTLYLYNKSMYSVATTGNIGIYVYLISGLIIITLGIGIKLFR